MWKYAVLALVLSALILGATAAHATSTTTWNIWPGGSIQLGIDLAVDGDTVRVHAGTYRENLVWDTKDLQLIGDGAATTIVNGDVDSDGTGDGSCLRMTNVPATARVEGFTFTKGNAPWGGGIYCGTSSPTIVHNEVTNNSAGSGGGISCEDGASPAIRNNNISGNVAAEWGGGISCRESLPSITGNTISNNSAEFCGGIECKDSSPSISGNIIDGNTADDYAGIGCAGSSSPVIANNTISGNTAISVGGGISCEWNATPTISSNTICSNSALMGSGIFSSASSPTITNTIIAFNTVGAGIYTQLGAAPAVTFCDVFGNASGEYGGELADQTGTNGNISLDPLFANAGVGDHHLKSVAGRWTPGDIWVTDAVHSPCIDTGDPASPFGNEPAHNGGRVNMGAFGNTAQASKHATTIHVPAYYPTIQMAINVACDGDTIQVAAGTYRENLAWSTKSLQLIGDGAATTIVNGDVDSDGTGDGSCLRMSGVPSTSRIEGFTFTKGLASAYYYPTNCGGGIYCTASSPTITNNTISGNSANYAGGIGCVDYSSPTINNNTISGNTAGKHAGGIFCNNYSSPTITGNTISGNTAGQFAGGIYCHYSSPSIRNNTISGNRGTWVGGIYCYYSSPTITNTIVAFSTGGEGISVGDGCGVMVTYCNVYGNAGGQYTGALADQTGLNGNISQDPLFADAAGGDFHLLSKGGRWDGTAWLTDAQHSPCIDTGDPGSDFSNEPAPNGSRINMGRWGNTAEASKWANRPPTVASVDITPDPAVTGDDLTATPFGWSDPDGDPAGYDFQWAKWDGAAWQDIAGADTDTLSFTETAKDDLIQVTCWPNDGAVQGTPVTDEITIGNSAPTVASVDITPDPAVTGDDLTATPSGWSDPDGDPAGYDWQWAEWNAGTTSWDDIPGATTDTLDSSNFVKGDQIQVTCWPNDGAVQGTPVTDEITIGNTAPTQPTVDVTPDSPNTGDDLQVAASGSTDADGDTITCHYEWYKDDVHQAAYDDQTTVPSVATTKGEVWRCDVTPNDGTEDGPSSQDQVTVANTAPTQPTVTITPPNPGTSESFRCVGSGSTDADGDQVEYRYQWYKNGVLQPGVTWQRIGARRTRRGQTWKCVVTPTDGKDNGPSGEGQVTIGNTAPTQPTVTIVPSAPTSEDSLRATALGSTDADGDSVSYSYQWYKNGVLQARCIWPGIAAWRTSSGQVWRCVVTPSDGTSDGPSGEDQVTIGNSAPTAPTVVITPGNPTTVDSFRATTSGSTDADGDSVSYSYQWYKNGVLQLRCVWPGVGAWRTSSGQVWRCVVTPSDGKEDGPTGEASVSISNSAPTAPTVVITPGDPTSADSFRATASGSTDADGDSVSYSYQWYRNGVLQPGVTWRTIGANRTREGQVWRCVVTPNDGFDDGPTGEARVTIGGKSGPLTVTGLAALPTARGAEIAFTLSADASVTCEVLNIAGRPVKIIVADRPMDEGINSLAWDGRNAAGLRAPAGMYLVRMTATAASGARWTAVGTLNLTR